MTAPLFSKSQVVCPVCACRLATVGQSVKVRRRVNSSVDNSIVDGLLVGAGFLVFDAPVSDILMGQAGILLFNISVFDVIIRQAGIR